MSALVRRLIVLYRRSTTSSGPSAASLAERVSGSKPESSIPSNGDGAPLSVEIEEWLARGLTMWERKIDGYTNPQLDKREKRGDARKAQAKAILGEVGASPVEVAFSHGVTEKWVRELRANAGRDTATGQRKTELRSERIDGKPTSQAPLTAPAATGLELLLRATNGEAST